jgi:hypothetical protein
MATVYIKPGTGSGSGTLAAPYFFDQLVTAETAAGSGGIIYFTDGDYDFTGDATFNSNGVTYQSLNPQKAILTRTGLSSGDSSGQLVVGQNSNTNAPKVKNFKIVDMKVWFYQPSGLTGDNVPTLQGCNISSTTDLDVGTGIIRVTGGSSGYPIKILDNSIAFKLKSNVTFWATRLDEATFEGNSIYLDNSLTASNVDSNYDSTTSKNNIFMSADNSKMGSRTIASNSSNCCFFQFHSNNTSGGTNNVFENPLYVDPDNGDLRLRPSSPCINAGTAS